MPVFRNRVALDLARDLKAFLNVEAGLTRGEVPGSNAPRRTPRQAVAPPGEVESLRRKLESREAEISRLKAQANPESRIGVRPENVIWSFGMARTGSTWLNKMMGDLSGYRKWNEPLIGALFGRQYYQHAWEKQHKGENFIMADRYKESWLNSIRTFFLAEANAHHPDLKPEEYLYVKEPNGSIGAPLLVQALPESRMVFLIRDPRDVVASSIDGHKEGAWSSTRRAAEGTNARPENTQARKSAEKYLEFIGKAREAYELHTGPKVFVRYEELRADTPATMERVFSTLDLPVDKAELHRVIERHSWENIPDKKKGEGKFFRKATSGSWKEDLTPEQVKIVEETTAPLLKEFYA